MQTRARLARHLAAPDLACGITGTLPTESWQGGRVERAPRPLRAEVAALVEQPKVRVTVHAKQRNTVEVRVLSQLPNGNWHRMGTLCMARSIWERDWLGLLARGAHHSDIALTITEAAA